MNAVLYNPTATKKERYDKTIFSIVNSSDYKGD